MKHLLRPIRTTQSPGIDRCRNFLDDAGAFAGKFMAPAVTDRPRDAKPPARSDLMRPENDGKLRFIPAGDMGASRFSMSASGIEKKAIAAATQAMANCIRAEFPQSERND